MFHAPTTVASAVGSTTTCERALSRCAIAAGTNKITVAKRENNIRFISFHLVSCCQEFMRGIISPFGAMGNKKSSPPYEGGVAAASADGVVFSNGRFNLTGSVSISSRRNRRPESEIGTNNVKHPFRFLKHLTVLKPNDADAF